MAVALAYPESRQGKRDKTTSGLNHDVEESYIRRARFVLRHCGDKAEEVLRNAKYPLTVAYEEAQAIVEKQRRDDEERERQLKEFLDEPWRGECLPRQTRLAPARMDEPPRVLFGIIPFHLHPRAHG